MSEKARNHYIPRFLLNRFSSRRSGSKYFIWITDAEGRQIEVSTKDAAVSRYFYGSGDSAIEDGLGVAETKYSSAVLQIIDGDSLHAHKDVLRSFVYLMLCRTDNLRKKTGCTVSDLLREMETNFSPEFVLGILEQIPDERFFEAIENELEGYSEDQRKAISVSLGTPAGIENAKKMMAQNLSLSGIVPDFLSAMFEGFGAKVSGAIEVAQIRGLRGVLKGGIPEGFDPPYWSLIKNTSPLSVIGDCVAIVRSESGEYGNFFGMANNWETVYIPITPEYLLAASKSAEDQSITSKSFDLHSIQLSSKCVFSRCRLDREFISQEFCGKGEGLIGQEDILRIIKSIMDDPWG